MPEAVGAQVDYKRSDRVADLIRGEVASMIAMGELKDPRIGFITITKVQMGADMKRARVFFSMIEEGDARVQSVEGLNSARGYVRRALAKRLDLKNIPEVLFEFDDTLEYSSRINQVIKSIHKDDEGNENEIDENDDRDDRDDNDEGEG